MLEIRLLGKFAVAVDGRPVDLPLRAAQSLLAYLALSPGTPHRREQLAGLLWPDMDEATAKGNLRHILWRLRKALGPTDVILADELTLTFDPAADVWLDAWVVGAKLPAGASTDDFISAVSAYGGELLPGFYDDWVVLERERLQAAFEQKMGTLLDCLLSTQRWADVLEWGERWIALGHTPEAAYRALIITHGSQGDSAAAAAAYRRCLEALRSSLGVEPSAETRTALDATGRTKPASGPSHNLPAHLNRFVGRETEMAEIKTRLAGCRLVTLTGAGGIGKTRLALQVAGELQATFPHGVRWVELAPLSDSALVPQAIAAALALNLRPGVPVPVALSNYLQTKNLLLVLDNCEHFRGRAADDDRRGFRDGPAMALAASHTNILAVSPALVPYSFGVSCGLRAKMAWVSSSSVTCSFLAGSYFTLTRTPSLSR